MQILRSEESAGNPQCAKVCAGTTGNLKMYPKLSHYVRCKSSIRLITKYVKLENTSVRQIGFIVTLLLELEIYEIQELTLNS